MPIGIKRGLLASLIVFFALSNGFGTSAFALSPIEGIRHCKALLTKSIRREPNLRERFDSLSEARAVFAAIVAANEIPFAYSAGGCEARAHALALKLEQLGFYSRKIMMEGMIPIPNPEVQDSIRFGDHVAVAVKIAHLNFVFDPTFFTGPVPVREWIRKFTTKPTHLVTIEQRLKIPEPENLDEPIYFFAERFYLTPSHTVNDMRKWSSGDAEYVDRSLQRQWYSLTRQSKN